MTTRPPITPAKLKALLREIKAAGGRRVRVDLGNGASMDIELIEQQAGPRTEADAAFETWQSRKP